MNENDVLGFGESQDEKFDNPFADETPEGGETFSGDEDDQDEELDLRDDAGTGNSEGDGSDAGANAAEDTEEAKVQKIMEQYGNDPAKLAKALQNLQALNARQGNELGELRKSKETAAPETSQEQAPETAPTVGPNGFRLDEFGLEVIPDAYFASKSFVSRVEEFLSKPANLVRYLEETGFSPEEARAEAQAAYDEDRVEGFVRAMSEGYRSEYKENYQSARQERASAAEKAFLEQAEKEKPLQIAECERQRGIIATQLGLSGESATRVTTAIHNAAAALVRADVEKGALSKARQFSTEIVQEYYAKALSGLVSTGEYAKLRDASQAPEKLTPVEAGKQKQSEPAQQQVATQQARIAPVTLGKDAEALYKSISQYRKGYTREDFVKEHGRTVDIRK